MTAVYWKEMADFFATRRFAVLLLLIALAGVWAAYNASQVILDEAGQAPTDFVFLRLFTTSRGDSAITFVFFLGIFGPLLGLSLGFNAINDEKARGTLPRLLSQPIHRDALITGKFFAAITVLGITDAVPDPGDRRRRPLHPGVRARHERDGPHRALLRRDARVHRRLARAVDPVLACVRTRGGLGDGRPGTVGWC